MLINDNCFREVAISGVPSFSPLSYEYKEWWTEQKNRCINGYTVGGKWMPGKLYWYVNFWHIERQVGKADRKKIGLPDLRPEIEWEVFNIIEKCRNHIGFDELGIPLYDKSKSVKGFLMITGRRTGKSYMGAAMAAHEYTFFKNNEIVVSSSISTYTSAFMNQIKLGLSLLPGGMSINGEDYPAPFHRSRVRDNWKEEIRAGIKVKKEGVETVKGSNSRILPITYNHNPMAANGKAPSFHVFEEIGSFFNLKECYSASQKCWQNENYQFGVPYLIGTGGDMDKGTIDARDMFENPDAYDLISFDSDFYDKPTCFFIPAWKKLSEFRKEDGLIDKEEAIASLLQTREKKKTDQVAYEQELQYEPITPQEAFLQSSGNIFPKDLLQTQLSDMMSSKYTKYLGQPGRLNWDRLGGLNWEPSDQLYEVNYPHKKDKKGDGCIVIYEQPDIDPSTGIAPSGVYIGGCDPYNKDQSIDSDSLGSIFIFKEFYSASKTFHIIVAEYTGRPATTDEFFENCRKLAYYYNAVILHETQSSADGMKAYFEKKNCLQFLKKTPNILHSIVSKSNVNSNSYGTPMPKEVKSQMINFLNNFLREEITVGVSNTTKVYPINLLKELISYHNAGNFDRVIAFGLCILHHEDINKNRIAEMQNKAMNNGAGPLDYFFKNDKKRSYY